jgi:hypothetical protein
MIHLPDELTPEQEAAFPKFREKWIEIAKNTEPMDKQKSQEAAIQCYDLAGVSRPEFMVFLKSPFQLFYAAALWNEIVDFFSEVKEYDDGKIEGALWYSALPLLMTGDEEEDWRMEMRIKAIADSFDAIIDATKDKVPDIDFGGDEQEYYRAFATFQKNAIDHIQEFVLGLKDKAEDMRGNELYGQSETWLCFYEFMEQCGGTGLEATHGLQNLAKACGWWMPCTEVAFIADRPYEIHVDDEGDLHSHETAAIKYRDGWKYYASHGMQIPMWIIENPELITAEKIWNERNVEIRRVMVELFGFDKLLEESNAQELDRSPDPHIGTLWLIPQEDDEDIYLLEMRNSTQELDGSWKTYVVRVPPTVETAQHANAWSYGFGDEPERYKPEMQS